MISRPVRDAQTIIFVAALAKGVVVGVSKSRPHNHLITSSISDLVLSLTITTEPNESFIQIFSK